MMDSFAEGRSESCDLVVKVGGEGIRAHKSVLIEHSNFCKALFCGQFEDSVKSEIDLSEIAANVSDVKSVVSFMYTGDITVTTENLADLMKLSSYLAVAALDKYLEKHMLDTLSVTTCLKYYCLCHQYGLMEVKRKASAILKSRFHDCVINDENSLDVTDQMLKDVFNKGFMKFCSTYAVLRFIAKWLQRSTENANSKVEVAYYILSSVSKTKDQRRPKSIIPEESLDEDLRKMKKVLESDQIQAADIQQLLDLFERTVGNINAKADIPKKLDEKRNTSVLVTLSSRDMPEGKRHLHEKHVFDLCIYSLETGMWHLLTTFKKKAIKENAEINLNEDFFTLEDSEGKLYLMDGFTCDIASYDYANKVWSYQESFLSDLVLNDKFEHYSSLFMTASPSGDLYLVVEVLKWRYDIRQFGDIEELQDENILDDFYFVVASYQKDAGTFCEVFRTELIPVTSKEMEYNIIEMSNCSVRVNKKKEMIFVHTTDTENAVVVLFDIKENTPPKVIPFTIEESDISDMSFSLCILEEEDKFVVIDEGKHDKMKILFECEFGSDKLNFDIDHNEMRYIHSYENFKLGTRHHRTVSGQGSLWHIEKLCEEAAVCRQVVFSGQPSIVDHTPPPFTHIISAHEMDFPIEVLEKLDPLTDFLSYGKYRNHKKNF